MLKLWKTVLMTLKTQFLESVNHFRVVEEP